MGDYNVNLLNHNCHNPTSEFIENIMSNTFYPLISMPTRISDNSATLIDNIFTNVTENILQVSGVLITDISDHFPIFHIGCPVNLSKSKSINPKTKYVVNEQTLNALNVDLTLVDWSMVYQKSDPNDAYNCFYSIYKSLYDKHICTNK